MIPNEERTEEIKGTSGHKASEAPETNVVKSTEKTLPKFNTISGGNKHGGNHQQKAIPKTISFAKGKGNLHHNNRDFIAKNVDRERTEDNITIKKESLEEAYKKNFGEAIEEYNAGQKRKDRHKTVKGYIEEIKKQENSKGGTHLYYEQVIQLGTQYDSGNKLNPVEAEKTSQALLEYCQDFQKRNPNLYVFNAVIHRDEATPHLHIDYIPIAREGAKRGLKVRNSFTQALREQGITVNKENNKENKKENEFTVWRNRETEVLKKIAEKHNILVKDFNHEKRQHLTSDEYREIGRQATEQAKKEVQAEMTGLKEKNAGLEEKTAGLEQKNAELEKANEILQAKLQEQNQSKAVHQSELVKEKEPQQTEKKEVAQEQKPEPVKEQSKEQEQVKIPEKLETKEKQQELGKNEGLIHPSEPRKEPDTKVDTQEKEEIKEQKPEAVPGLSPEQQQVLLMEIENLQEEKAKLAARQKKIEEEIYKGNTAQLDVEFKIQAAEAKVADAHFWNKADRQKEVNKLIAYHKKIEKELARMQKLSDDNYFNIQKNDTAIEKVDRQLHPEKYAEIDKKKALEAEKTKNVTKYINNTKARSIIHQNEAVKKVQKVITKNKSRGGFSR